MSRVLYANSDLEDIWKDLSLLPCDWVMKSMKYWMEPNGNSRSVPSRKHFEVRQSHQEDVRLCWSTGKRCGPVNTRLPHRAAGKEPGTGRRLQVI